MASAIVEEDADGWGAAMFKFRRKAKRTQADYLPTTTITFSKMKTLHKDKPRDHFDDWDKNLRGIIQKDKLLDLIDVKIPRPAYSETDEKAENWRALSANAARWIWENCLRWCY
ncbi:hypothetical protein N7528_009415 [Penicillium herquei]|nr:hypothetical protein N7528_009415 [Penicillium herquei]